MRIIAIDEDNRSNCISVLTDMLLEEYKRLAFDSFNANGNFAGQRGVITKSAAAARIRKRMQDDFCRGTIFPQVVLGIQSSKDFINDLKVGDDYDSLVIFKDCTISIIDGMQRSNIYFKNYKGNENRKIRVEFWIANNSEKLLYRMLVLNTGQTPWNTRRQIEVIYGNLSKSIEQGLYETYPELREKIELYAIDDGKRRTQAGKYHKSSIIELYLGFNIRNVKINVSDELAEEYQRFDVMESIEEEDAFDVFICIFAMMCMLDLAFAQYTKKCEEPGQFTEGKDIFGSSTSCVGFVVASAEFIYGKISVKRKKDKVREKLEEYQKQMHEIIHQVNSNIIENDEYLSLEVLNAKCAGLPKTRIGDEMRIMFKDAFMSMLKYEDMDEILSLGDFWRE